MSVDARFQGEQVTPEIVGHRGFRGSFPENTLLAMRKGAEAGSVCIETDVQLAKDGVMVMCHDVDTGRCFNKKLVVEDTPYHGVLDQLVTKGEFKERMPTLVETLEMFMKDASMQNVRLMLDIKRSNRPHVIPYVKDALQSVAPLTTWADGRLTLGVWQADVMEAISKHLPMLPATFIGIEHRTARHFMHTWPNQVKAISMAYFSLACGGGHELMVEATQRNVDVYSWTVNEPDAMKWAVAARVKGLITDYPDVMRVFFKSITDKDMMSQYFQSEPRVFYSTLASLRMWCMYIMATCYLAMADSMPWLFGRW